MKPAIDSPLPASEGYRLWAATYEDETPVSVLDTLAVERLTPEIGQRALLDVGCGTGRRLPEASPNGPKLAVGIDLVWEMLIAGRRSRPSQLRTAVGDVRSLPIASACFDVVWCRLTIGHVEEIVPAYAELARVTRPGGHVIVTDFHPAAAQQGFVRSFSDGAGDSHIVEHYTYQPNDHERAARAASLSLDSSLNLCVGPEVRSIYHDAGLDKQYERQHGLPVVLAMRFSA